MIITDYRTSIFLRRSSEGNIDSYEYTDLEISRQLENICFVAQLDLRFVTKLPWRMLRWNLKQFIQVINRVSLFCSAFSSTYKS